MALISDFKQQPMRCGYEPCEHEGIIGYNQSDPFQAYNIYKVHQCPECKVWNYSFENYAKKRFTIKDKLQLMRPLSIF